MTRTEYQRAKAQLQELAGRMKQVVNRADADDKLSPEDEVEWQKLDGEFRMLQGKTRLFEIDHNLRGGNSPSIYGDPFAGSAEADAASGGGEVWIDERSGRRLMRFERGVSLENHVRSGNAEVAERYGSMRFADYCRSLILGPRNDIERRTLAESTDSAGGYATPELLSAEYIDNLRAQSVVFESGARLFAVESDSHAVAKVLTDPTPSWTAENAAITASDPTFGRLTFTPKKLTVLVKLSRELAEDAPNIGEMLSTSITGAMAAEIDRVGLLGSGSGNEPTGLTNTTGINAISMGTNGGSLSDYGELITAAQDILDANASMPDTAIMAPRTAAEYAALADSNNQPLQRPSWIAGIAFRATTAIPVDQTQGTSSNGSSIFIGDFRGLWVGVRSKIRLEVLKETYAENFQYAILASARLDIQIPHAAAFTKIIGIIP